MPALRRAEQVAAAKCAFPRKLAALRAHESQTGHMADLAGRLATRLTRMAQTGGPPAGHLAEAFRVLDTA